MASDPHDLGVAATLVGIELCVQVKGGVVRSPAWLAVVAIAVSVGIRMIRDSQPHPVRRPSPLDLLERRFAAGESTRDDFDEARARLRGHELDL